MIKLNLKVFLIMLLISVGSINVAYADDGGDSGAGGGMSIVDFNNKVRLIDLVHENDEFIINRKLESLENYNQRMNVKFNSRFTKWPIGVQSVLGKEFNESLALMKTFKKEYPILDDLVEYKCSKAPVFLMKSRIKINRFARFNFWSQRFDINIQEPLAYFYLDRLIFSEILIRELSPVDYLALGIHECLRFLNNDRLQYGLSTSEIEALTRFLVSKSFSSDEKVINELKIKLKRIADQIMPYDLWIVAGQEKADYNKMLFNQIKDIDLSNPSEVNLFSGKLAELRSQYLAKIQRSQIYNIYNETPTSRAEKLFSSLEEGNLPNLNFNLKADISYLEFKKEFQSLEINQIDIDDFFKLYEDATSYRDFLNRIKTHRI